MKKRASRLPRWPGVRFPEATGTELGTWQGPDPCGSPRGRVRRKKTAARRQGELADPRGREFWLSEVLRSGLSSGLRRSGSQCVIREMTLAGQSPSN